MANILYENPDWIQNPVIERKIIDKALMLEKLEQKIIEITGQNDLKLLLAKSMEEEIKASSAIEGIQMDSMKLRSSIAKNKGWINDAWDINRQDTGKEARAVKASIFFMQSGYLITHDTICLSHSMLPPENAAGWGKYRDHLESVYDENDISVYDAPDASEVQKLMTQFVNWWNNRKDELPLAINSSLAHLYFETIHPFHDGNGRIGRMLLDKAWQKSATFRPFSISSAIIQDKNRYYDYINQAQINGKLHEWIAYMVNLQESAIQTAMEKAKKLANIHNWLENSDFDLNSSDLAIIYEIGLSNKSFWTFFEATKYMPDGELAENAWDKLNSLGIIKNGKLDLIQNMSSNYEYEYYNFSK